MATNLSKDFDAFLEVWNKLNYDRTKEEQEFCFNFKRQIFPTLLLLVDGENSQDALNKIEQLGYDESIRIVWKQLTNAI